MSQPSIRTEPGVRTRVAFWRTDPTQLDQLTGYVTSDLDARSDDPDLLSAVALGGRDRSAVATYEQWHDTSLEPAAPAPFEADRDINLYELVHHWTASGQPLPLDPGPDACVVLDIIPFSKPENWDDAVAFFVQNARDFEGHTGFDGVAILTSIDRTRIVTYAHWSDETAFLRTVSAVSGSRIPALVGVRDLPELNAALRPVGEQVGGIPEYHSYDVIASRTGAAAGTRA